jgi:hypothetical protein
MRQPWAPIILLFSCTFCVGQSTWHGLHFGMSQSDAQAFLKRDNISFQPRADYTSGDFTLSPDYGVREPGTALTFWFKPTLRFGLTGLSLIDLILDTSKYCPSKAQTMSCKSDESSAARTIFDELAGKYGQPVEGNGPCRQATDALDDRATGQSVGFISCDAEWGKDHQIVSFNWSLDSDGLFSLFVQYESSNVGL